MATPRYRVYHRNGVYDRVDEITDWLKLALVTRFNDVGSWTMELLRDSPSADLLTKQSGIIVTRDDVTIFSGRVATEFTKTAKTIKLSGWDDMALLRAPSLPTTSGPPYSEEYALHGPAQASTVMRQLVHTNIGSGARADRVVANFDVVADPLLGTTVTSRTRFDRLVEELQRLAVAGGGLRFTLQQSDAVPNTLLFDITEPVDRTDDAKFSIELGTALDFEDTWQAPDYNYVYVLGGEEMGAERPVTEGGDAASIAEVGWQIEAVLDARGSPNDDELDQKLTEALEGAKPQRKITVTPFENPSVEFGVDYDTGDLVSFVIDGEEYQAIIREAKIELDPEKGAIVTPMIADPGATNDPLAVQQFRALATRVRYLEQNWNLPPITMAAIGDIGTMRVTAASAASAGWLLCQGQAVSRTTYAALFAVTGTTYGPGNGTTTFNVPDARGRFMMGASGSHALGSTGGAETYDMSHAHPHDHDNETGLPSTFDDKPPGAGGGSAGGDDHRHSIPSDSTSGGSATQSVLNPFLAANWEIFTGVI